MTPDEYLAAIHLNLVTSPIVVRYWVVRQRVTSQRGHLRVRIDLSNGDFLEAAHENFSANENCSGNETSDSFLVTVNNVDPDNPLALRNLAAVERALGNLDAGRMLDARAAEIDAARRPPQ